jgi:hypothetical protein
VADINAKIVEGNRKAASGPPLNLMPFDVERVVGAWRERAAPRGEWSHHDRQVNGIEPRIRGPSVRASR